MGAIRVPGILENGGQSLGICQVVGVCRLGHRSSRVVSRSLGLGKDDAPLQISSEHLYLNNGHICGDQHRQASEGSPRYLFQLLCEGKLSRKQIFF